MTLIFFYFRLPFMAEILSIRRKTINVIQSINQSSISEGQHSRGGYVSFYRGFYLFTLHWLKSLSKSRAWRCSWRKIVIVYQPIRAIFSIFDLSWVKIQFFLSSSTQNIFFYAIRKLVPFDASEINQLDAQLLVSTFVKSLWLIDWIVFYAVSVIVLRYNITIP